MKSGDVLKVAEKETFIRTSVENFEIEERAEGNREKSPETSGKLIWRFVNVMMTAFFIMAAGVQFNDPDPWLWVPLYGTAAVLTSCVAFRPSLSEHKRWRCLYWTHACFSLGMFVYVLVELIIAVANPDSDGTFNPLTYEEGRELAGVMITAVWLFTCKQSPTISSDEAGAEMKKYSITTTVVILFSILPIFLWGLCYTNVLDTPYFSLCTDFWVQNYEHDL